MTILVVVLAACDSESTDRHVAGALPGSAPDTGWQLVHSFGALATPESEVLGEVRQAIVDRNGRITVLDALRHEILIVEREGTLKGVLGGKGVGPGELFDPVGIMRVEPDRLIVVDRARSLVQVLLVEGGSAVEQRRFRVPFRPGSGCAIGKRLFLLGFLDGRVLHEVDLDTGAPIYSFDASSITDSLSDRSPANLARMAEVSEGRIYCSTDPDRILHAPAQLGWVRSYRLDGTLEWHTLLDDFVEPVRTSVGEGVRYDVDPSVGYVNTVSHLSAIGGDTIAVRMEYAWPRRLARAVVGETVLMNGADGRELRRIKGEDPIMDAIGRYVITVGEDPYPQVHLWER